jgi:hypothetical protein
MAKMGLGTPGGNSISFKRKFRWMFWILPLNFDNNIVGDISEGLNVLPPLKGARPNLGFKEWNAEHLNETLYFPGKPDWKTISLSVYDFCHATGTEGQHRIFEWLKEIYNPEDGEWFPVLGDTSVDQYKKKGLLELYSGCGEVIEKWVFENIWPTQLNFQDLDMSSSELAIVELTLRYDRAYTTSQGDIASTIFTPNL